MAFFDPGSIVWEVTSSDKLDAIREIISQVPVFADTPDFDQADFIQKVITREQLQSTGFGHGVAIAHGRTDQVNEPYIALGISHEGIEYEAFDGKPVHLLFIVANHPDRQTDYLSVLSTLVAMVRNELFRQEILSCRQVCDVQTKLS